MAKPNRCGIIIRVSGDVTGRSSLDEALQVALCGMFEVV
jgi:hypothetical protein